MTESEYLALNSMHESRTKTQAVLSLFKHCTGTLLYGYNLDRKTVHVYAKDGQVHRVVYDFDGILFGYKNADTPGLVLSDLVPDKRLYPGACDAAFCSQLMQSGVTLPFTTFEALNPDTLFYGKTKEELLDVSAELWQVSVDELPEPAEALFTVGGSRLSVAELQSVAPEVVEQILSAVRSCTKERVLQMLAPKKEQRDTTRWISNMLDWLSRTVEVHNQDSGTEEYYVDSQKLHLSATSEGLSGYKDQLLALVGQKETAAKTYLYARTPEPA